MADRFKHVALVGKTQAHGFRPVLEEVAQFLLGLGLEVSVEAATAQTNGLTGYDALPPEALGRDCDVAVVVGGDGTMLGFARQMASYGIPLVGINQGRLGFITDISKERYREVLPPILSGTYEVESRGMLEGRVLRGGEVIYTGLALNDVVVSRGGNSGMVELRIHVGDERVANMRADGVIVSTPTGSTAYALSAGGPILHPSIAGWVLVPIASHTLTNRPIVLPDAGPVRMEIVAGRDTSVNFDMQRLASLLVGDEIVVRRSAHSVKFLHPKGWSYYATLRKKLRWYEG